MSDGYIGQIHHTQGRRQDHSVTGSGDTALYRQRVEAYLADSDALDGFGRLRVSSPTTLFDAQQEYGLDLQRTWDATANGTLPTILSTDGSVTSGSNAVGPTNATTRLTPITVSSTNGHYSVLQSRQYVRYIPGKGQLVFVTGIFASGASASANIVRRTSTSGSAVDTAVAQASWNIDPLDGTGPSGVTIDFTKTQILVIDAQWLGVGRVRVGFDIDGCIVPAHEFLNANNLTVPYTQHFNLPVRLEIRNTGASESKARVGYFDSANGIFLETVRATAGGTINLVCASVQSEGGEEARGFPLSASNGITTIGVTTRRPILSIRPKALYNTRTNRGHIEIEDVSLAASTNDAYVEIVIGGTLTGATWLPTGAVFTAGSFVVGVRYIIISIGTTDFTLIGAASNTVGVVFVATGAGTGSGTAARAESIAEYDVSATAISGGTSVIKGFVPAGTGITRGVNGGGIDFRNPLTLSQIDALTATQTPVSLVCTSFTGTSNVSGIFNWHEQTL